MILAAFGILAFACLLCVLLVFLEGRLVLALIRRQGLIDASEMTVPKYRPRKAPVAEAPKDLDLTHTAPRPIGLDGTV